MTLRYVQGLALVCALLGFSVFFYKQAVLGLPLTVVLNREGQEIARLRGDAEWDSDSAKAILSALVGGES